MADKTKDAPQAEKLAIKMSRLTPVNAANTAKTVDGATHVMRRAFYTPVLLTNDEEGFINMVREYRSTATILNGGRLFDVTADDGTIAAADRKATVEVPTLAKREEKVVDGKAEVTVDHGQNVTAAHPVDFKDLMECLMVGLKYAVRLEASQEVTKKFRDGEGKKGKQPAKLSDDWA